MSQKTPPKRDVMMALLQQADSVFVNFDPRREGVVVPPQLKRQPRVVLQYGMNMAIPIPDLDVGADGIGATLSFDRTPTWTFVPWSAVFAIVSQDQRGMLWENDMPREVEAEAKKPAPAVAPAPESKKGGARGSKKPAKRPALRAVDGGQPKEAPDAKPAKEAPRAVKIEEARPQPATGATTDPQAPRAAGSTSTDEIVEPPRRDPKKKRELPPYLRVVK